MSIRLTKKQLIQMAERLDAIRCPVGNVYTYENMIYAIERINRQPDWRQLDISRFDSIVNILCYLERVFISNNADGIRCRQIAYSAGTYGNTGQLHAAQFWKDDKIINTLFIYY